MLEQQNRFNNKRSRRTVLKEGLNLLVGGAALAFLSGASKRPENRSLVFANYDNYIGPHTLDDFEAQTGTRVSMDLFADNGDLFTKMRAGTQHYDVIIATSDWVSRYTSANYLHPLNWSQLPNVRQHSFPRFLDAPFDPKRKYSVTYTWGTIGIGYRKSCVQGTPNSWKWVYDSDAYKGRIALQASCDDLIGPAVIYLGGRIDSTDPALYEKAYELIRKQRPFVRVFAAGNGQDALASRDVDLIVEQNGDIRQVMEEDSDLAFTLPREGGIIWQDNLCIPRGARNPKLAHAFIDFLYQPQVNAQIFNAIRFGTPNKAAYQLMPASYRDDPVIFPPPSELDACQMATFVNEKIWNLRYDLCLKSRL